MKYKSGEVAAVIGTVQRCMRLLRQVLEGKDSDYYWTYKEPYQ